MNLMYLNLAMLGCLLIAINVAVIVLFYPHYIKPIVDEIQRKRMIHRMLEQAVITRRMRE